MTDHELADAVDSIMDAEEDRQVWGRAEAVMAEVSVVLDRAAEIHKLRLSQGKALSGTIQNTLSQMAGQLVELKKVLGGCP
jgi:hypothetical protein